MPQCDGSVSFVAMYTLYTMYRTKTLMHVHTLPEVLAFRRAHGIIIVVSEQPQMVAVAAIPLQPVRTAGGTGTLHYQEETL